MKDRLENSLPKLAKLKIDLATKKGIEWVKEFSRVLSNSNYKFIENLKMLFAFLYDNIFTAVNRKLKRQLGMFYLLKYEG